MCYYTSAVNELQVNIRVWRSLVSRLNGVQEAASSNLVTRTTEKPHLSSDKCGFFRTKCAFGTISTPSVREVMLRIVKRLRAWVAHLTSLRASARYFTAATPLLHLGYAQTSLNMEALCFSQIQPQLCSQGCGFLLAEIIARQIKLGCCLVLCSISLFSR